MTLPDREAQLRRSLNLEYVTIGWKLAEGLIGVVAAWRARSVALLAFGVDGVAECASAAVLVWRLRAERGGASGDRIERLERRAQRFVGWSLLVLAAYVMVNAVHVLMEHERTTASRLGVGLLAASLGVMWWLASAKKAAAVALGSGALAADAFQTRVCAWLAALTLAGMALDRGFGLWWADSVAALAMNHLLVLAALRLLRPSQAGEPPHLGGALT